MPLTHGEAHALLRRRVAERGGGPITSRDLFADPLFLVPGVNEAIRKAGGMKRFITPSLGLWWEEFRGIRLVVPTQAETAAAVRIQSVARGRLARDEGVPACIAAVQGMLGRLDLGASEP